MALAGGVKVQNCKKEYTYTLILQNERDKKRGDSASGTGNFVCEDAPIKENQQLSKDWKMPYIDLKIEVIKNSDEVENLRDGIIIECQEFDCPFNTGGKER